MSKATDIDLHRELDKLRDAVRKAADEFRAPRGRRKPTPPPRVPTRSVERADFLQRFAG